MQLLRFVGTPVLVGTLATTSACASSNAERPVTATVSLAVPEKSAEAAMADTEPEEPKAATPRSIEQTVNACTTAPKGRACSLAADDVATFCREMTPDRAVKAFATGTKLSRAFLAGDVDAWSTIAGVRTSKTKAAFDEEVLVLAETKSRGGIVVSGSAVTYEVLRWDGTCATLSGGEVTFKRPPAPKRPVDFGKLDDATVRWLGADAALGKAEAARSVSCGSGSGSGSGTCAKAMSRRDAALGRFVLGK